MRNESVLFVTTVMTTIEAFLLPHMQYFINKGYQVGIATNTENKNVDHLEKMGVTIHHVPFSRTLKDKNNVASYKIMKRIIKDYHILHLHTPISSFVTRMAATKDHVVIYSVHGFHFNENGRWITNLLYKIAEKIAGWKTDILVVTNKDDLTAARQIVSEKKIRYVPGVGLDISIYDINLCSAEEKRQTKIKLGLDPNKKIITHIAEFNQNKRQIDVVNACEMLKEKEKNFTIIFVGIGEDFEIVQSHIRERNLDEYIKCLGFRKDVPKILCITDVGLLVSIREGLPRSVMEMMAMRIPVIATNIRGNRDLIVNGENGYLIPINDPYEIAEKCLLLLNDESLSKEMGENGKEKIEQEFSIDHVLREMELIYKELSIISTYSVTRDKI